MGDREELIEAWKIMEDEKLSDEDKFMSIRRVVYGEFI